MSDRRDPENGRGRRLVDQTPAARVIVDGLQNGAQNEIDKLLHLATEICDRADKAATWMRRIGLIVAVGVVTFIFSAGAWYFKVDSHVDTDEILTKQNSELVSRAIIVLEGLESRVGRVERQLDEVGDAP